MVTAVTAGEMVRLVVPGPAVPLARARVTGRGTYLPARSREFRERCRAVWLEAGRPHLEGPVQLSLLFVFERPRSHLRRDGSVRPGTTPLPRGDVDNLAKAVLDALAGCLFGDDRLVASLVAVKRWGGESMTIVTAHRWDV